MSIEIKFSRMKISCSSFELKEGKVKKSAMVFRLIEALVLHNEGGNLMRKRYFTLCFQMNIIYIYYTT